MPIDLTSVRQKYENMVFLCVDERRVTRSGTPMTERRAKLRCACGAEVFMSLSRWQNDPISNCQRCTIKKAKRAGWHGFRARKKPSQALDTLK
jgi:hypothetical protein